MNSTQGTPKTIDEAITNALLECEIYTTTDRAALDSVSLSIKQHLRDFIAQKAFHRNETTAAHYRELFYKIFGLEEGK